MPMNHRLLRPRRRVTVPGAPTITMATEGDGVTWTAPTSDGGKPIAEYRIYQDGAYLDATAGSQSSWPYAASPGSTYEVSAVNEIGEGPRSALVVAT